MNHKTVLQYLSSSSDAFLVVAFASLLALPIAIALTTQPVAKQTDSVITANRVQTNPVTQTTISVLGVSTEALHVDAKSNIQNVGVKFGASVDNKLTVNYSSATAGEYSIGVNVKSAGTYDLFTFTNNNSTSMTLDLSSSFTDSKLQVMLLLIGGKTYNVSASNPGSQQIVLGANSQLTVSAQASSKLLGSFKLTAKVS